MEPEWVQGCLAALDRFANDPERIRRLKNQLSLTQSLAVRAGFALVAAPGLAPRAESGLESGLESRLDSRLGSRFGSRLEAGVEAGVEARAGARSAARPTCSDNSS